MKLVLLICMLSSGLSAQEYAGDPIRIGVGARALGMGSAYVAVSDDATSLYWNNAGLARVDRTEAHAQHSERFGGTVNLDNLAIASPTQYGTFGLGLTRIGVDGITLTGLEDPSAPVGPGNRPTVVGSTSTSEYLAQIGFARTLRPDLSVGGSLKFIWRNLEAGDGTGYGIDLGLHYSPSAEWNVGVAIRDLNETPITFDSGEKDRVSRALSLGVAFSPEDTYMSGRIVIAASALLGGSISSAEEGQRVRAGLEYRHRKGISGRLGLEGDHFTAGAGIEPMDRIRVDVAFLEHGELDNTYRISASVVF